MFVESVFYIGSVLEPVEPREPGGEPLGLELREESSYETPQVDHRTLWSNRQASTNCQGARSKLDEEGPQVEELLDHRSIQEADKLRCPRTSSTGSDEDDEGSAEEDEGEAVS